MPRSFAAESMKETANMTERVKLNFGDHFATKYHVGVIIRQDGDTGGGEGEIKLLFPSDVTSCPEKDPSAASRLYLLGGRDETRCRN